MLAKWFEGREIAFAFGFTLMISRLSSVATLNLQTPIYNSIGLGGCNTKNLRKRINLKIGAWIGFIIVGVGAALVVFQIILEKTQGKYLFEQKVKE